MLQLGEYIFQEDLTTRESSLMFFPADEEESASWSFDCSFLDGRFEEEKISPSICINPIEYYGYEKLYEIDAKSGWFSDGDETLEAYIDWVNYQMELSEEL